MSETVLPAAIRDYLVGGRAVLIATVDTDGLPYSSVVGSCVALPDGRLRFAAWGRGSTLEALRTSGTACVVTLGEGAIFSLSGKATVVKSPMDSSAFPPHPYVMVEIQPEETRDLLAGRRVTSFVHEYEGDNVAERLERRDALIAELRAHPTGDGRGAQREEQA